MAAGSKDGNDQVKTIDNFAADYEKYESVIRGVQPEGKKDTAHEAVHAGHIAQESLANNDQETGSPVKKPSSTTKPHARNRASTEKTSASIPDEVMSAGTDIKEEIVLQDTAKQPTGPAAKYSGMVVYNDSTFDQLPIDPDLKYQLGLAAGNALKSESYSGHESPANPTTDCRVVVVDDMAQMHGALKQNEVSASLRVPFENVGQLKHGVAHYRGDAIDGVKQDLLVVSRDYLKANLKSEIEFLKSYEESAARTRQGGEYQTKADFLADLRKDSPLKVNSFEDVGSEFKDAPRIAPPEDIAARGRK